MRRYNPIENDEFLVIPLKISAAGLIQRQCPSPACRKSFQVKPSIPLLLSVRRTCPYCGLVAGEVDFWTDAQWDWLKNNLKGEFPAALKHLKQIEVELLPEESTGPPGARWKSVECRHCGKTSAVEAEATYCPDCGMVVKPGLPPKKGERPDLAGPPRGPRPLQAPPANRAFEEVIRALSSEPAEPGSLLADLSELLRKNHQIQQMGERQKLALELGQLARQHGYLDHKSHQELQVPLACLAVLYPEAADLVASIFRVPPTSGSERMGLERPRSSRNPGFRVKFTPLEGGPFSRVLGGNLRNSLLYALFFLTSVFWLLLFRGP